MVKLNIYSSSSSPPAATTPPYSSANRNQRGGGSSTKFGGKPHSSGGGSAAKFGGKPKPWTPTARPSFRKAQENGENFGGKKRAQSEPRKHFQPRHQQSPFAKPILKMPNSAKPAVVDHQRTPFKFGQKRRVSFGSESNGSVEKQRKMLRVEKSGDETPKIGDQILHQKMNGGSATSKGAGNRTPKAFDHKRVPSAQRQPTIANVVENATTTTTPVVQKAKQYQQDTGKAVQQQQENGKKGQQQQQPEKDKAVQQRGKGKKGQQQQQPEKDKAVQQPEKGKKVQQQQQPEKGKKVQQQQQPEKDKAVQQPEKGKKVQQQQQPEKGKTVQQREKGKKVQQRQQNNTAVVTTTTALIKNEAKPQTQQKVSESDKKGAVPVSKREKKRLQKKNRKAKIEQQQQKGQLKHETSQKNEKNKHEKLTRQAVETLQNAVNMMQNGDVKEEAEKEGGGKNDNALFNTVASALERLIPARFSFGHMRSFRFSAEHSNAIVRMGAVLEPKKFKQFVQLTSVSNEGSKTAEEKEEDEPRVLAHTLWVLSASLCLLGHAASAAGGEKNVQRHDEYLKEAVELRKMARDLLSSATDGAADVQQKQQQFVTAVAAMAPALVDLVLAWASRTAWIHRALGAFALSRFAKWLRCAQLEPILEAIVQKDAELLQAEGESDDEEEEDEEEMEGEDKSEDEAEEDEEEEKKAEVNPKLVADVRKAMGKAAFPKNVAEVPSDEDNWELSDDQMFRLDHDLARAFRKHSSQRVELARQASIFRMRLIDLLFAYLSVAPYSEAMSLSMHILSSVVWRTNSNQKKLGIQVIEPLLRRKKENTASSKRLAKLFKQLIDGASTEQPEQQHTSKREAAEAVARGSLLLFSLASDHEEHKCAPELFQLVEQKLLNAYFTDDRNTNRTLLQSTVLERLCRQYPQYLGSKFLLTILDFAIDNKVPENKKLQAFNFAHSLLSRKDSPEYYATVLDDIGTYFARAVPLFIKQSAPTDDIRKMKRLLAKFVFMLGWFLNGKIASEASTKAIKQSLARAAIDGPLDEQKLTALLGQDGMKELRRFLMLRGAIQQFGGDKMVAVRFIAALGKKLEVLMVDVKTADEEEGDEDESELDDEEEEEEADDGEETDDEMDDEEEEEMEDEDEDDDDDVE
uniref:Uncharacterized protein n=1 Tax=Globodera rostochiensis TaxID=31243 RepID=A0A914I107_GLORO